MTIAIKIVSIGQRPLDGPRATFGPAGGTIGRRSDMTLVIPDKSRRVSRVHAIVTCQNGQYRIRDQGSFLPVYVNGHGVGFQRDMTIHPGDRIQIGEFGFLVSLADATAPTVETPTAEAEGRTPAPFHLKTLSMAESAPASAAVTPPAGVPTGRAIEDGPATFALLEQRLAAQSRNVPWPDVSMYRDVPLEERAVPIAFDAAATQDLHTERRTAADAARGAVANERQGADIPASAQPPDADDHGATPPAADDAPSEGGYVIPIRKRRRRA